MQIFAICWQLLFLRSSPEHLPASRPILFLLVAWLITAQAISQWISLGQWNWLAALLTVMIGILLKSLPLILWRKSERLNQALLAFLLTEFLITLPLFIALMLLDPIRYSTILVVLYLWSIGWRVIVGAFIFLKSLETSWWTAGALGAVTVFFQFNISQVVLTLLRS